MSDAFASLERFVRHEMRMSHIYQPVMLLELLNMNLAPADVAIAEELVRRYE